MAKKLKGKFAYSWDWNWRKFDFFMGMINEKLSEKLGTKTASIVLILGFIALFAFLFFMDFVEKNLTGLLVDLILLTYIVLMILASKEGYME